METDRDHELADYARTTESMSLPQTLVLTEGVATRDYEQPSVSTEVTSHIKSVY